MEKIELEPLQLTAIIITGIEFGQFEQDSDTAKEALQRRIDLLSPTITAEQMSLIIAAFDDSLELILKAQEQALNIK